MTEKALSFTAYTLFMSEQKEIFDYTSVYALERKPYRSSPLGRIVFEVVFILSC